MKIEQIFNKKTQKVKWDNVWNIPEFHVLMETKQSKVWHQEGCVARHTMMVVDAMEKEIVRKANNTEYRMIMLLAALFHDIGKGATTIYDKQRDDWSAINHANVGEEITRRLLWDEDPFIRETLCYFVKNHMKPLYILHNIDSTRDLIKMSCESLYEKYCTIKNLCILKKCDNLGAIFDKDDNWVEKLELTKLIAEEVGCYESPYHFSNGVTKWEFFNNSIDSKPTDKEDKTTFNMYVLFGTNNLDFGNSLIIPHIDSSVENVHDEILDYFDDERSFSVNANDIDDEEFEDILESATFYDAKIIFVYSSEFFQQYKPTTLCMEYIIT